MISRLKTDNRLQVSLVALFAMLAFVLIILIRYDWDPMAFVMEGTRFREGIPDGTWGYDGQFAYYIALYPLGAPPWMDHDAYRYQRILYPFLAWVFSFGGQPALIPWVMIAINIICILTATWLLSGILSDRGFPPWIALSFVFFIGVFMALRGNLLEPLAISLSLLGLVFSYREKWIWAGVAFALAVLAKEMALAFLLGVVAWLFLRNTPSIIWERLNQLSMREWGFLRQEDQSSQRQIWDNPQRQTGDIPGKTNATEQSPSGLISLLNAYRLPITLLLGGVLPALAWGVILTLWLGHSPMSAPFAAMEKMPFYGLRYVDMSPAMGVILIWVALPAILFGILGILDIRRWKDSPETLILLANVALIAFMPRLTWYNVGGALRVGIGLVVASLLYIAVTRPKLMPWTFAFWIISGLIMIPALIYGVE